jgi:hypothetical protein
MDASERLAEQYLLNLGVGAVLFEPDGNIPPDFSVGGHIGVEVRRLNQNYIYTDGKTEGLEESAIPLWQRMKKFLHAIGPSINGESWFVGIDFRRPIDPWRSLEVKIRRELVAFMQSSTRSARTIQITPNFELDLLRASKDHGEFFLLGASSDNDSGGWIMSEVEKNLRLCILEKERKIAPYRNKYSAWWLVLADHIDYSMEPEDRQVFRTEVMPSITHFFDKIVFVDPTNHQNTFEV